MRARLHGVICPDCGIRATAVALDAGPQLVRHDYRKRGVARCKKTWLVEPDPVNERLNLFELPADRLVQDEALAQAVEKFVRERDLERAEAAAQAVEDVFGLKVNPIEGLRMVG